MAFTAATLKTHCANILGVDTNNGTISTLLDEWTDLVYGDFGSRNNWSFLESKMTIWTTPDYTEGTASATEGGTTVTGTDAFWSVDDDYIDPYGFYINFAGTGDWYPIVGRTDNPLILGFPFIGPDDLTNSAYTLRKFYYNLADYPLISDPSDPSSARLNYIDEIKGINVYAKGTKLTRISPRDFDSFISTASSTSSTPYSYMIWRGLGTTYNPGSTSSQIQLTLYPFPSERLNMEIRYYKILGKDTASIINIPIKYQMIVEQGILWHGYMFMKQNIQANTAYGNYERGIERAIMSDGKNGDWHPVLDTIESNYNRIGMAQLGSNYPYIYP